jgi:hypothetical protein
MYYSKESIKDRFRKEKGVKRNFLFKIILSWRPCRISRTKNFSMYSLFSCLFLISTVSRASTILEKLNSIPLDNEKDFVTAFYKLETIYKSINETLERYDFNGFVSSKYLKPIKGYLDSNSEIFLTKAMNSSNIIFQIFLSFLDFGIDDPYFFFKSLRDQCIVLKNPQNADTEDVKLSISMNEEKKLPDITEKARKFAEKRISILLRNPSADWEQSEKIIRLYMNFLRTIKSFVFPFEGTGFCSTSLGADIERYEFIVEKFSEFTKNEYQVAELVKAYIELTTLPTFDPFGNSNFDSWLNNVGRKLYLFSLFSSNILSSEELKLENFPEFNTKILCLSIKVEFLLWSIPSCFIWNCLYKKRVITDLHRCFMAAETALIDSAFNILYEDLKRVAISASANNLMLCEILLKNGGTIPPSDHIVSFKYEVINSGLKFIK